MREGRRNLQFFEEKLRDHQMRRLGHGVDSMSLSSSSTAVNSIRPKSSDMRGDAEGPPTPPPKDTSGYGGTDRGSYGSGGYSNIGGHGDMMPPRHPYAPPGPGSAIPKQRPNFTKLGMHILQCVHGDSGAGFH
jgi:classical protein kinase C